MGCSMKRLVAALLLAGISLAPAGAATEVIRIHAFVPVICHADFAGVPAPQGPLMQLGNLTEFCNDSSGYRIVADYTQASDPGELIIDGVPVVLNPSGHVVLTQTNGPRAVTQSIAYRPGSTPITTISIQLQAASI